VVRVIPLVAGFFGRGALSGAVRSVASKVGLGSILGFGLGWQVGGSSGTTPTGLASAGAGALSTGLKTLGSPLGLGLVAAAGLGLTLWLARPRAGVA
jgi:hypothetical protein